MLARAGGRPLRLGQAGPIRVVGRAEHRQGLAGARFDRRGGGDVAAKGVALRGQPGFVLRERGDLALCASDPLLGHGRGRLGAGTPMLRLETRRVVGREARRQPVATLAEIGGSGLPRGETGAGVVRCRPASISVGRRRGRGRRHAIDRLAETRELAVQARALRLVPGDLPGDRLGFAGHGPFGLFGSTAVRGQAGLVGTSGIQRATSLRRRGDACRDRALQLGELRLGAFQVGVQASVFRPPFQHGIRGPERDAGVIDDGRTVSGDRHPARRQRCLDGEACGEVGHPDGPREQAPHATGRIPPDRFDQPTTAGLGDGVQAAAGRRVRDRHLARQPFLDQQAAALGGEVRHFARSRRGRPVPGRPGRPPRPRADPDPRRDPHPAGGRRPCAPPVRSGDAPPRPDDPPGLPLDRAAPRPPRKRWPPDRPSRPVPPRPSQAPPARLRASPGLSTLRSAPVPAMSSPSRAVP